MPSPKPLTMKNLLLLILFILPNVILSQISNPDVPANERALDSVIQKVNADMDVLQLKLTPQMVDSVYVGLKQHGMMKKEIARLKEKARELNAIIQSQHDDMENLAGQLELANTQIDRGVEKLVKNAGELQKAKDTGKRFGIGPAVIYSFDGKICGGIGVHYDFIRF